MRRVAGPGGSATVLVAVGAAATVAFALVLAAVSVVLAAGARARTAADLAALAAADAVGAGRAACPVAGTLAAANAATLVSCVPDTHGVTVVVEVRTSAAAGWRPVRARARAEPGAVGAAAVAGRGIRRTHDHRRHAA